MKEKPGSMHLAPLGSIRVLAGMIAACAFAMLFASRAPIAVVADAFKEIPLEVMLGDKAALAAWRSEFGRWYSSKIDSISGFTPLRHQVVSTESFQDITLITIRFEYPRGTPLYNKPGGGVLAVPRTIDPLKPVIVAIHGHEHSPWGTYPVGLFKDKQWPYELVCGGYVVWAPVSMYHEEISSVADSSGGYPLVWTKIISEGMNYGSKHIWEEGTVGMTVAGLSSGGQTAYLLMAYRDDIRIGVFAGVEQNLDFLRREYRVKGHPDCWDIRGISSYSSIRSLLSPRPVQFQSGRNDPFYPNKKPLEPNGDWFKGTSRGQFSSEVGGGALIVKSIYEQMDAVANYSFVIHDGGHEFDTKDALLFIEAKTASAVE